MNKRTFRQLQWSDRLRIEALFRVHTKVKDIAAIIGCSQQTIYNELKRGQYEHTNSDLSTTLCYSSDLAQQHYEQGLKMRGAPLKIGTDIKYLAYIENKIINDKYSPAAVLADLKLTGKEKEFDTIVCKTTIYSYIDKGLFLHLKNDHLPYRHTRRSHPRRIQKRVSAGDSIEKRPDLINNRTEFGHWEMDSVIGKQGKHQTLLVLSERKTRYELIVKLPDHGSEAVVKALDRLERKYKGSFRTVFKSITVDNGVEFAAVNQLERNHRTKMYYCHPYSSWERGTNENINRMIRRHIPKGKNIDDLTENQITYIQNWINNYPRSCKKDKSIYTASALFTYEISKIINSV